MEQIRLATIKDATSIALLGRVTFTEAFGHLFNDVQDLRNYLNTTFAVEKIEQSIEKENNVYWIAFVDKLPVGYAKLKLKSPSDFVTSGFISQLQKIYVLQDFLSMKIGKHLQYELLKRAKQEGSKHIWLSVYKGNQRAISFYERNNFTPVGKHQFRIGKQTFDFMAMSKALNDD